MWLSIDHRLTDTDRYQLTTVIHIDWFRLIDPLSDYRFSSVAYAGYKFISCATPSLDQISWNVSPEVTNKGEFIKTPSNTIVTVGCIIHECITHEAESSWKIESTLTNLAGLFIHSYKRKDNRLINYRFFPYINRKSIQLLPVKEKWNRLNLSVVEPH